jgi:hypothetical protein
MKVRYREKTEPDYVLFEILSILIEARSKIRNKNVKRFEDQLQVVIDAVYQDLRDM